MHHRNKSIATKTTWRLNTAAVIESSKQEKEIFKNRRYAILIKTLSLITLLLAKLRIQKKHLQFLFDFCTKMAKVCLFLCC